MLEPMARGGMRIGEVLNLTPDDIEDRKIFIKDPKSGRQAEVVFIPQKAVARLKGYIRDADLGENQRIYQFHIPLQGWLLIKLAALWGLI